MSFHEPQRDLDRNAFYKQVTSLGFELIGERDYRHETYWGRAVFNLRPELTRRAIVATLAVMVREEEARRRGGRFVTTKNVPGWLEGAA